MPFESEQQRKAMYAAASGKSNIGIPKEVAEKFIKHSEDAQNSDVNNLDWLKNVLLVEMIKGDDIPDEPTLLSTPEFKKEDADLPTAMRRLELNHLKDQLGEITQAIQGIKKDAEEELTEAPETPDLPEDVEVRLGKQSEDDGGPMEGSITDGGPVEGNVVDTSEEKADADPCWKGYEQIGMKEKDGKSVPNCVPLSDAAEPVAAEPIIEMPINNEGGALGRAAGIMFITPDGETLLIRRGAGGGDYPNTWCVPGGHQKDGETLEETARRECFEETGLKYEGKLDILYDDGQFCTYVARDVKKEPVTLNYESSGYDWCNIATPPLPLHPGLDNAFKISMAKTEYDYAELISKNILPSPQMYANVMLLAIRITGTGLAYRSSIGEHVWRDPSLYLNEEFLKRCNGLTVIMDHPETAVLTSDEFKNRAIGSIMLPYLQGDEVWGIAKIYDQDSANEILEGEISTSPSVVFDNTAGNTTLTTENGEPLLIEGVPFLLDHIAIVTKARGSKGVWDKGGDATGVLLTNPEVSDMTENTIEPKADAQGEKLDTILSILGKVVARVDEMEKNLPAAPLVTATDKKAKADEDMEAMDDEEEKEAEIKKDAVVGGVVEMPAGEIKFDEEEAMCDDEEEAAKADEEEAKFADAQAKCDSVLSAFGKSASRPLQGENLLAYRKRLLRGLQAYSDSYKDISLTSIKDAKLLDLAEKQIFADALSAAKSPMMFAADQLVEINEKDRAGRTITKFKGAMSAWLDDFKVPSMRVKEFHLSNNKR